MRCVRGSGHVSSFWTSRAGYVSEQKRYGQRGIRRIQKHATLMQARAGGLYQWRAPPGTMNEKVPADQEQGPVPVAGSPQLEKCRLQTHARGREKNDFEAEQLQAKVTTTAQGNHEEVVIPPRLAFVDSDDWEVLRSVSRLHLGIMLEASMVNNGVR